MKTPEELNALKKEVEIMNAKLTGLSEEELKQVTGGKGGHRKGGRGETQYCKYCCTQTYQTWTGIGEGWDRDGDKHMCDLWLCQRCECTNYRDVNTGRLL